jgi:hypothetical protein
LQLNTTELIAPFWLELPLSLNEFKLMRNVNSVQFILTQIAPHPEDLSTFALMLTPDIPITGLGSDLFIVVFRKVIDQFRP